MPEAKAGLAQLPTVTAGAEERVAPAGEVDAEAMAQIICMAAAGVLAARYQLTVLLERTVGALEYLVAAQGERGQQGLRGARAVQFHRQLVVREHVALAEAERTIARMAGYPRFTMHLGAGMAPEVAPAGASIRATVLMAAAVAVAQ